MILETAAASATTQISWLWLIPFFPAFGALINGVRGLVARARGKNLSPVSVDVFALGSMGIAFVLSLIAFVKLLGMSPESRSLGQTLWSWFDLGGAHVLGGLAQNKITWAYKFDVLSACMTLLVTGVGFLIHLFSAGYMAEERKDGQYYRFMCYLNLFVFSMLNLVLGSNIMMMFLGWEGVGLCSYLLIGFYFDLESAAVAGKKAFVVNRIGDFGFMIGFFLLFMLFGSLDFDTLMGMTREFMALPQVTLFGITHTPTWWFNVAGCCLFLGACGKSAQIPLYVWLPDAMAGPTPVSALIHAATMVTSGLYMMTRMNFLYINAPVALTVVLCVGALTALAAASMGLAQYDIKKVLAYSTVSQLGFMFMGMGVGAFSAGMFHVFTHAFFKAALFLGAGSVIVACHHEQDLRNMGGLRKKMPLTFASMAIATLAIAGIFPFSGFFSKDEILWKVFDAWYQHGAFGGSKLALVAWIMGMLAAFMTAFYMTRLMVMTFFGEYRGAGHDPYHLRAPQEHGDHGDHGHAHEPKEVAWTMWLPVALLALLALVGGWLNMPHSLHWLGGEHFNRFLEPLLYQTGAHHGAHTAAPAMEYGLMVWATVIWAPAAILLAWWIYKMDPSWSKAKAFATRYPNLFRWVHYRYYVDEFYEATVIVPFKQLGSTLSSFDSKVVDGLVNLVAVLLNALSGGFKRIQSGRVQHYAFVMFLGFLVFALWKFLA